MGNTIVIIRTWSLEKRDPDWAWIIKLGTQKAIPAPKKQVITVDEIRISSPLWLENDICGIDLGGRI